MFLTKDGGKTWTDISTNLEENPDGTGNGPSVRWVDIVGESYYAGTSTGLYRADATLAGELTWVPEGVDEIGNVVVTMMKSRSADSVLYVGTHGNGVYSSSIEIPCKTTPTVAPSNYRTTEISPINSSIAFDEGDGDFHVILIKEGSDFEAADLPVNGQIYEANTAFGEGSQVGDAFVVFNGVNDSITVTGLLENITYFVTIISYNCASSPQYLNTTRLNGQISTVCEGPTINASNVSIESASLRTLELNWEAGDGRARVVLLKEGEQFEAADLPVNGETYISNANFEQGDQIGNAFVVSNSGNRTSVTVRNITPGNEYCVTVIEYNCNNPQYLLENRETSCIVTTSVEDDLLNAALSIFPNPAQELLNIQLESVQYQEVETLLYNTHGELVIQKPLQREVSKFQTQLKIAELPKGVYFLKIKTKNAQSTQKIVIE